MDNFKTNSSEKVKERPEQIETYLTDPLRFSLLITFYREFKKLQGPTTLYKYFGLLFGLFLTFTYICRLSRLQTFLGFFATFTKYARLFGTFCNFFYFFGLFVYLKKILYALQSLQKKMNPLMIQL